MNPRRLLAALLAPLLVPSALVAQAKKPAASDARVVALARGLYRLTSLGDTALLSARIFGENFKPLAGVPIEWRSDDESIASAGATGAVVAMKNGTTRVWAKTGTDSVFAVVTVEQRASKLGWNVSNPLILDAIGASAQLRAEQRDARGYVVKGDYPLTACVLKDEGGSGAASIQAGRLLAKANGAATLSCKRGAVKDELKIVVRQVIFAAKVAGGDTVALAVAGDTTRLQVQVFDRLGKPIADARGSWATLTPEIVEVEPNGGTILGKSQGTGRVTAKFDNAVDTITVNVLGPLPEGRTMPTLTRARPAQVVQAQPVASSGGGVPVGGAAAQVTGAAAPAPSAPVLPPSGSSQRPTLGTYIAPRGQTATFASAGSAGSTAVDSVAIAKIIEAGLSQGGAGERTWVVTPMVAQAEYRVLVDSTGTVYTTGGLLIGGGGTIGLTRALFLEGHFLTGSLKASSSTITNVYDGTFGDARLDLGYEPLAGFVLRAGYGVRGIERLFFASKEQWTMLRTGLEGRFGLFGDRIKANMGFTYFPSLSVKGQAGDVPSTAFGANAGVTYRAGWFTLGVNYSAESIEFNKPNLSSAYQRQARYSMLAISLGGHWGR